MQNTICFCTQFNEDKNIPHSSDHQIRQARVLFMSNTENEIQKSKSLLLSGMCRSDLNQEKERLKLISKKAIRLAAQTEEYEQMTKICRRCSLYYQKYGNFDEALEMERKAYASQLMLIDSKDRSTVILSSALGVFGAMSLLLGLLWKKHLSVHSQLDTFKEEMQMKEVESDNWRCNVIISKKSINPFNSIFMKILRLSRKSVS